MDRHSLALGASSKTLGSPYLALPPMVKAEQGERNSPGLLKSLRCLRLCPDTRVARGGAAWAWLQVPTFLEKDKLALRGEECQMKKRLPTGLILGSQQRPSSSWCRAPYPTPLRRFRLLSRTGGKENMHMHVLPSHSHAHTPLLQAGLVNALSCPVRGGSKSVLLTPHSSITQESPTNYY